MRKLTFTAALVAAFFTSAKAQSINFVTACETPSRTINLKLEHTHSDKMTNVSVESHCPKQQLPKFKLEGGNYQLLDIPKRDKETWFYKVEREGKTIEKGELVAPFFTTLLDDDILTIVIAAPISCNCETK